MNVIIILFFCFVVASLIFLTILLGVVSYFNKLKNSNYNLPNLPEVIHNERYKVELAGGRILYYKKESEIPDWVNSSIRLGFATKTN